MSTNTELTPVERDLMGHALGAHAHYRHHYVTDQASPDGQVWEGLVARGLASKTGPISWMGGMILYRVTAAGFEVFDLESTP